VREKRREAEAVFLLLALFLFAPTTGTLKQANYHPILSVQWIEVVNKMAAFLFLQSSRQRFRKIME